MTDDTTPRTLHSPWFEFAAVACIGVGEPLLRCLGYLVQPAATSSDSVSGGPAGFAITLLVHTLGSMCIAVPVLWIMSRHRDSLAHFGFRPLRRAADIGWSLLVVVAYIAATYAVSLLLWLGYMVFSPLQSIVQFVPASGATAEFSRAPMALPDWLLFIASCLANGFAEELVCRAYLQTRLRDLLGSPFKAIVISSAMFASYHIYQGSEAVITMFAGGLAFGLMFHLRRSIWPVALGHAWLDILMWLAYAHGYGR